MDQSFTGRQSRKNPKDSSFIGIKNGSISRRRSAPGLRRSRISQMQPKGTTPQRATSNLSGYITTNIEGEGEGEAVDQYIDQLNISSTSTAAEYMEASEHSDVDCDQVSSIDNINQSGRSIKKHEFC